MTPQEKALELFEKLRDNLIWSEDSKEDAKKCALIVVDEIIASNPHSNPFNTDVYSTMDWWMEVKKEIELL